MPLHTERQRFQTAQDKKTIERAGDCADRILQECNLISELLVFANDNNAAHEIGMPVQIFRRGMHDNVEARLDWTLDPGSGKCVVGRSEERRVGKECRSRWWVWN